jgi:hypothetical protein
MQMNKFQQSKGQVKKRRIEDQNLLIKLHLKNRISKGLMMLLIKKATLKANSQFLTVDKEVDKRAI